jgi:hypothetical protein
MAQIGLRFVTNNGATTLIGQLTVSDANAARILAAEAVNLRTVGNQATVDALIARYLAEMIGDVQTIERNQTVVAGIPVTP